METRKNKIKSIYLFLPLLLLLSCKSEPEKKVANDSKIIQNSSTKDSIIGRGTFLTDEELEYIKTRDGYVEYFKKKQKPIGFDKKFDDEFDKQDRDSLLVLERLMKNILKDSRVNKGTNNLETLCDDEGFGRLDGLDGVYDSLGVFCTTKNLFFYYFINNKINQLDQLTSTDFSKILTSTFTTDAAISALTTIKLPSKNNVQAYGIVSFEAQDEGPFPPDEIYVFVANDKYVYIARSKQDVKLTEVKECRKLWDSLIAKQGDPDIVENEAWYKYSDCCEKGYKKEPQFERIKKEMEDIAKQIEQ